MKNLLTHNECINVLKNDLKVDVNKIKLINFEVIPAPTDVMGMLGEYFYLVAKAKIVGQKEDTYEYFIKSLPIADELQTKFVNEFKVFPKETQLFTTLIPELDKYSSCKWHAECYFVRSDIVVMEDLNKKQYRHPNDGESLSMDHFNVTLKKIAAMHASGIILEERTGINIGEKCGSMLEEVSVIPDSVWYQIGLKATQAVAKTMPQYQSSEDSKFIAENLMRCMEETYELVETSHQFRNVFCHRDLWLNNILFKYDENDCHPVDCVLVDFQIARYHPPALDVLQFIYLNTSRKFRQLHLDSLLEVYYNFLSGELNIAGIDINTEITWKEFLDSCEHTKLVALVLSSIFTQLANLPKGYLNEFKKQDPQQFNRFVSIDRNNSVLELMEGNESYKNRMLECIEEIVEYSKRICCHKLANK